MLLVGTSCSNGSDSTDDVSAPSTDPAALGPSVETTDPITSATGATLQVATGDDASGTGAATDASDPASAATDTTDDGTTGDDGTSEATSTSVTTGSSNTASSVSTATTASNTTGSTATTNATGSTATSPTTIRRTTTTSATTTTRPATTPSTNATTTTARPTTTRAPTTTTTQPTTTIQPGVHPDIVRVINVVGRNPGGDGWKDSYSVGDQCYCATTFDHGIGTIQVNTPAGTKTVREVCEKLGPGPGSQGRPIYNDIQCGNGPANDAGDEDDCPGRVDIGRDGCGHIGPTWDLSVFP
ncbi:MAG: hypothetical protein AAFO29_18505 [Actinomycetota bacterium]